MVANGEADALVSERVWRELEGALGTASPQRCFEVLARMRRAAGVAARICATPTRRAARPAGAAAAAAAPRRQQMPVRWASLLAGLPPAEVETLCARLRVPNEHRDLAVLAARLERGSKRAVAETRPPATRSGCCSLLEQADAFRRPERFAQLAGGARRPAWRGGRARSARLRALPRGLRTRAAARRGGAADRRGTRDPPRPADRRPAARAAARGAARASRAAERHAQQRARSPLQQAAQVLHAECRQRRHRAAR